MNISEMVECLDTERLIKIMEEGAGALKETYNKLEISRRALLGISTCSTCSACREAALLTLEKINGEHTRRQSETGSGSTSDLVRSLLRQTSKKRNGSTEP